MPIHDWTRVLPGTWHDFHLVWIAELRNALNGGVLPSQYYAQAEQIAGRIEPDVLTLHMNEPDGVSSLDDEGGVVCLPRPKLRVRQKFEIDLYAEKGRVLAIRHSSGDRIVALIELVSPGNKSSKNALDSFIDKAYSALRVGCHLLIIDLFPPTPRDPERIHGRIMREFGEEPEPLPPDEPLTLAAYVAQGVKEAYVEPTAVGKTLIDMPLFLDEDRYVNVPLDKTYEAAFRGVPRKWQAVLNAENRG